VIILNYFYLWKQILSFEDIFHYQEIIVALAETDRLMREIDEIYVSQIQLQQQ